MIKYGNTENRLDGCGSFCYAKNAELIYRD